MSNKNNFAWIVNVIVTLSNVAALPSIMAATSLVDRVVITSIMVASTLMHASERKHKLPGLHPFNKLANQFLFIDRSLSYITGAYFVYYYWPVILSNYYLALFGVVVVRLAEGYEGGYVFFTITHVLWHFSVFRMTYLIVNA